MKQDGGVPCPVNRENVKYMYIYIYSVRYTQLVKSLPLRRGICGFRYILERVSIICQL
jgi:hypothetical protein